MDAGVEAAGAGAAETVVLGENDYLVEKLVGERIVRGRRQFRAAGGKEQAAEAAERETVAAAVAPFSPDRSLAAAAIARMEALGASQASIARQLGVHPVYLSCCALRARMPHWPCPLPDIR